MVESAPPRQSVVRLFFLSFFFSAHQFFLVSRHNKKKGGGEDPLDPLPSVTGIGHYGDCVDDSTRCAHVSHHSLVQKHT